MWRARQKRHAETPNTFQHPPQRGTRTTRRQCSTPGCPGRNPPVRAGKERAPRRHITSRSSSARHSVLPRPVLLPLPPCPNPRDCGEEGKACGSSRGDTGGGKAGRAWQRGGRRRHSTGSQSRSHQPSTQSREGSPLESSSCPWRSEGRVPGRADGRGPAPGLRWKLVRPRSPPAAAMSGPGSSRARREGRALAPPMGGRLGERRPNGSPRCWHVPSRGAVKGARSERGGESGTGAAEGHWGRVRRWGGRQRARSGAGSAVRVPWRGHPACPVGARGVCRAGRAAGRERTGSPGAASAPSERACKGKVLVKRIYLAACNIICEYACTPCLFVHSHGSVWFNALTWEQDLASAWWPWTKTCGRKS